MRPGLFIYSLGAWLIQGPLPLDVSISSPLAGTDLLLCALFGGLISGVGSGLAIRGGGAMDGMEVMAVIFARKLGMTVGTFEAKCFSLLTVTSVDVDSSMSNLTGLCSNQSQRTSSPASSSS